MVQLEQTEHPPVFDASLFSSDGSVTTTVAVVVVGTAASLSK